MIDVDKHIGRLHEITQELLKMDKLEKEQAKLHHELREHFRPFVNKFLKDYNLVRSTYSKTAHSYPDLSLTRIDHFGFNTKYTSIEFPYSYDTRYDTPYRHGLDRLFSVPISDILTPDKFFEEMLVKLQAEEKKSVESRRGELERKLRETKKELDSLNKS